MAGAINTRFVAAINAGGGRAAGPDGRGRRGRAGGAGAAVHERGGPDGVARPGRASPFTTGTPHLLAHLLAGGYVPVIATIGADAGGALYNVNADTMAAAVAIRLNAARLVIGGTTPGVLDEQSRTIAALDRAAEGALIAGGTVNRGMLAKLQACRAALDGGVDGRRHHGRP